MNRLAKKVDEEENEDLGDETADFVGDGMVEKLMKAGQLFDGSEAPVEKEIGKFDKVG